MKKIEIKSFVQKPYNEKPVRNFKANPLDVNLASMQERMLKRSENEVCEYGDFAPVVEKYSISPNYRDQVFADEIKLVCQNSRENNINKKQRILKLIVNNPDNTTETHCIIAKGTKKEILKTLKDEGLFLDLKNDILTIAKKYQKHS